MAHRFKRLETRESADGNEKWLNWVVRLSNGELAGYVQATVLQSGSSFVAYVLASRHWRGGIGRAAVELMMEELRSSYGVRSFVAVLKASNHRSLALLRAIGFRPASPGQAVESGAEPDELVMVMAAGASRVRSGQLRRQASKE